MKKLFNILFSMMIIFAILVFSPYIGSATETAIDESDFDNVNTVIEKISKIGNVTIYSGEKIKDARTAYDDLDDSQKDFVENLSVLIDAENEILNLYSEISNANYEIIYETTGRYIESLGTPSVGSVGGEWMVICLTRSGRDCPDGYYENVVEYVKENINDKEQLHKAKSTDNSRVILALTSAGYDVTNVDGHNLLKGLSDMNYLKKQGVNGPIWALIALDSYNYEIPQNEDKETQATREDIITYILEKQLPDGGWSIFGKVADPDMTGMAIQALAPYCNTTPEVEIAVEKALECLSEIQHENGSFGSIDGNCSESCAQVIVALTSLGIDPETDERFIKNGVSVVDALCIFAIDEGGFEHIPYGGLNGMATEQGQYALVAYSRFLQEKSYLYDMTDVSIISVEEDEEYEHNEDYDDFVDYDSYEDFDDYDIVSSDDFDADEVSVSTESEKNEEEYKEEIEIEENEAEPIEEIIFTENTFSDIEEEEWYYESVKYVYENNLMQGAENKFEPEKKMTRAMLVTVLYRMTNPDNVINTHYFTDVYENQWYSDAVAWAAGKNIISGVSENQFAPEENVTREQMALILYRYAKMHGLDVTASSSIKTFKDANDVSGWAIHALDWANSVMLMNGTSDSTLSPKESATRAQVATILMRFCETINK